MKKTLNVASLSKRVGMNDGILVLRPLAYKMLELSRNSTGNIAPGDVVTCDLKGIIDCSSSFADEFILGWQRIINSVQNTLFILTNMNDDVRYTVEATLNQSNRLAKDNLSLIVFLNNQYMILGNKIEKNALEVFELMTKRKSITVREVADIFDLELNSASNRLKKLFDAHTVMRIEQSPDSGGKYEYYLPNIK